MKTGEAVYIAGFKTADDWRSFRARLVPGSDPPSWEKAFADYFYPRLSLRYLDPIRVLQENGTFQGEGFSIVAIQCTLIEFLESTVQGRSYRCRRSGKQGIGLHEYSNSSDLFVRFLSARKPFDQSFDRQLAREFYENVRCGLLHEARTKGGWTIWAKSPFGSLVSAANKTVYRDNFHAGLLELINWYKQALVSDVPLQEAFIRKFDSLCE
jgi:hypothetical protein